VWALDPEAEAREQAALAEKAAAEMAEEGAARARHPTARPVPAPEPDPEPRVAASLAPWAATSSGPTIGVRLPDDDPPAAHAKAPAAPARALPLWLCIGVPLVVVLIAFVAIAILTAPTGTDRLPAVGRQAEASGDRPAPDTGGAPTSATTAEPTTTTSTTATTAPAPSSTAPPTTAAAPTSTAAPAPPATTAVDAAVDPAVVVLPLVDAVNGDGCHPSYLPCVPVADDVDCRGDGDGPEYTGRVMVIGPDDYDLDPDGNSMGCA
jgi:hypothetical protein